ncbi:MAG: KH domain-containing protein [Clostridiales bacterium]|nr:KH domain-containing protein [Clostridiales bacterium]
MLVLSQVLTDIARAIVDNPDSVKVTESTDSDGNVLLVLNVAPEDVGMVIGRRGKIARAIRTVVKAAANSAGKKATVEIR